MTRRHGPRPTERPLEAVRRLDCGLYGTCLDIALAGRWEGFDCPPACAYYRQAPIEQLLADMDGLLAIAALIERAGQPTVYEIGSMRRGY